MEQKLETLKQVRNPPDLLTDYYRRENGLYYLSTEFLGQGTRDLYMLANIKGAFTEQELGSIAQ